MNYGFRKVLVPCSPPSISFSFFKISAMAQPEARSYKFRKVLVPCCLPFIPSFYLRLILQNLCEGVARSKVL